MQISVVMSTYWNESAANLKVAIDSILQQELAPFEFVIVGDGPLPEDQLVVINNARVASNFPVFFIQSKFNVGRGAARNLAIRHSRSPFVALMDSDDISLPSRLRIQSEYFAMHPEVDLVASLTEEFEDGNTNLRSVKFCPEEHHAIVKKLRFTNCVANPSILFKRSIWLDVGGFPDFRDINEDYLFYFNLIAKGATFSCVPTVLLKVRLNDGQRMRRRGINILKSDFIFRLTSFRNGYINFFWFFFPLMFLTIKRLCPPSIDKLLHKIWRLLSAV